jgi:DNA-binding protein H-NS
MSLFKNMKNMKKAVSEAPELIEQAQQMQAQAQQMQAAQATGGAFAGVPGAGEITPELLEPIAGVSLEQYARFAKTIGERKLDQAGTEAMVMGQGVTPEAWQTAYDGWNARFKDNMALSVHFGNLYQQAQSI